MPQDEIDITADLVDGSDGALADTLVGGDNVQQGAHDAAMQKPDGTVLAHEANKAPDTRELGLRDQLSKAFKGEEAPAQETAVDKPAVEAPTITKDGEGKYRQAD